MDTCNICVVVSMSQEYEQNSCLSICMFVSSSISFSFTYNLVIKETFFVLFILKPLFFSVLLSSSLTIIYYYFKCVYCIAKSHKKYLYNFNCRVLVVVALLLFCSLIPLKSVNHSKNVFILAMIRPAL